MLALTSPSGLNWMARDPLAPFRTSQALELQVCTATWAKKKKKSRILGLELRSLCLQDMHFTNCITHPTLPCSNHLLICFSSAFSIRKTGLCFSRHPEQSLAHQTAAAVDKVTAFFSLPELWGRDGLSWGYHPGAMPFLASSYPPPGISELHISYMILNWPFVFPQKEEDSFSACHVEAEAWSSGPEVGGLDWNVLQTLGQCPCKFWLPWWVMLFVPSVRWLQHPG